MGVEMIDHLGLTVSDMKKSREFYVKTLAPLNYELLMEFPSEGHGTPVALGFGERPHPDFWLGGGPVQARVHVAFRAKSRQQVDAFYKAAMEAGARDNGKPGLRPQYHENYYGAFVLDPDGHNIEAVCHNPD
jgi:catechol 2,3-dioxygenase-like lactoylglutathione lyase family enzyme